MKSTQILALSAALGLATLGVSGTAFAADGKALFTAKGCNACHGDEGKAPIMPTYPKLAGQSKEYTVAQLKHFADGTRSSGQAMLMKGVAAALKEDEMEAIADYLSKVE